MLWTDEAVESLRRLALAGMSASGIAAALGADSRNAVIGKANRIGVRLAGGRGGAAPSGGGTRSSSAARPGSAVGRGAVPLQTRDRRSTWIFADAEVGDMRRVRFADIREASCRWPIGDPRAGDFAYCGLAPAHGRSYCAGHCRIAYRPPGERRDRPPRGRQAVPRQVCGPS